MSISINNPIRVLNNKVELEQILVAFKAKPDYEALYRANVNPYITDLELSYMTKPYLKTVCAAAIWQNNNKGITKQSRSRVAFLKRFIKELCGVCHTTLCRIVKRANRQ